MTLQDWTVSSIYVSALVLSIWIYSPEALGQSVRFARAWKTRLHLRYLLRRHRKALALGRQVHEEIERARRLARLQERYVIAEAFSEQNEQIGHEQWPRDAA